MCVLVAQSCLTICDFVGCSQLGSSVHRNSPGKTTGLPFPSPGDLPDSGIEPMSPALQADSLPTEPPGKLYDRMHYSNKRERNRLGINIIILMKVNILKERSQTKESRYS